MNGQKHAVATRMFQFLFVAMAYICTFGSAAAGTLYVADNTNDELRTIDTNTLAVTTIGSLGTNVSFAGMAFDGNSQTLYMVGARGNENLFTVDVTTGAATLVGNYGITDLFGLAYDSTNDVLYGTQFVAGGGLFTLDTTTGAATLVATIADRIGGLAYDVDNDRLIGISDGTGNIYEINRNDASQTLLASPGTTNNSGLTYDPDLGVFWDADQNGNLFQYDPATGFSRTEVLNGLGSLDGLAYQTQGVTPPPPALPVPTLSLVANAMLILALAFVGLLVMRRYP